MSATGKTPILLYGSTTATNQPSASNLTNSSDGCEIAINVADKNLFFKDATNTVNTVPIRQSSASSDGWLSSTDWSTFNGKQAALVSGTNIKTVNGTTLLGSGDVGTIATGYGGTGLTSFTANQIFYASSTSAFAQSSGLTFNGTTFSTANDIQVNNIPFGKGAGTGTDNIRAGAYSLINNTTGSANISIGTQVNQLNTTGSRNVSIGYQTAYSCVDGSYNIAIGGNIPGVAAAALFSNVSGTYNVAIGTAALTSTTGSSNTAIGPRAGGSITSGNYNVVIGNYSGSAAPISATGSNYVVLSDGQGNIKAYGDASQNFNIPTGNLVIGTSGKGIDFSATAGTGTSELLADYEEGTFTPTVVGTTSAGTATYSYALGRYTKIGRMVEIEIAMGWSSGSGTGDFKIGGLPFTPAFYGPISINRLDNVALTASNIATAYTSAGEATITLRQYPVGGGSDSAVAYDAAGDMIVGGTFYV